MKNFTLTTPSDPANAANRASQSGASFIAGGTTVIDLWKLGAYPVDELIDITPLNLRGISASPSKLMLGALETMNAVGEHPDVKVNYPVISQSLLLSASPQIRNMGTMGGNLLQRPRSITYRNPDPTRRDGPSRFDAIFGITPHSRAPHPSDLAVALMTLDATVHVHNSSGIDTTVKLSDFYTTPNKDLRFYTISDGDLITGIEVTLPFAKRSAYIKIRDRASYQFAVVSAAVALDINGGAIRQARVAAGGVGTIPWRLPDVESALVGKVAGPETFNQAVASVGNGATLHAQNKFKVPLLQQTIIRALQTASQIA